MTNVGTDINPLRVAIIGSGPAGFYAADHLLKQKNISLEVDMFDRLPTPFGLVRAGVAPDHQKIKSVTRAFDRIAKRPNFRFFGHVEFGADIMLTDLVAHYHQIVFTTGSPTDRQLGIPGENLKNSHTATEFVAWYNCHPDYQEHKFDLSQENVAVIGVGNVAMDVARILARTPAELAETDIAPYAEEAINASNIKTIYILGRRGPAQAAFTTPEIRELGEMAGAEIMVLPEEAELDALSEAELAEASRADQKKVDIIKSYARPFTNKQAKKIILRFLVSPVELIGDEQGQVKAMRLVKNELYQTENGSVRPRATDKFEEIPVGLVFRSVGYRGLPLPDVAFNESWNVILNEAGRILNPQSKEAELGLYTAGWIKRGPSGVIGTNKADAVETANCMLEDLEKGHTLSPSNPNRADLEALLAAREIRYFTYQDWQCLDELEVAEGKKQGRPRVKFTNVEAMWQALDNSSQ